jgi:DNA-directed RNA polymerase subunit H
LAKKKLDVLRHDFVPKHIILTKEETNELLNKYKIRVIDLPKILNTDPVVFAVGGKEGDVIKILRKSRTTLEEIEYYRYVTKEKAS